MKAVVLAAGRGERLRPLTDQKPKALVEVASTPILSHLVGQLAEAGVGRVVIVAGYKADEIETECERLSERYDAEITIVTNEDYDETDNLYSLYLGLTETGIEPTIVVNGDVFCDDRIVEMAAADEEESIAFYDSSDFDPEELKLELDDGRPSAILDKGTREGAGSTIGMFSFNEEAASLLYEDLQEKVETEGSNNWFEASVDAIFDRTEFEAVDVRGHRWVEIDTEADLERATRLFSQDAGGGEG